MKRAITAVCVFLTAVAILLGYAMMGEAVHRGGIFDDGLATAGVSLMAVGITVIWLYYTKSKDVG